MYITAQRVRKQLPGGGAHSGFNTFLSLHEGEPIPSELSPDGLAESTGGKVRAKFIEVEPGGNFVDSYLDVVSSDNATPEAVESGLRAVRSSVPTDAREFRGSWADQGVLVRLATSRRIASRSAREEFDLLQTRAIALLRSWRTTRRARRAYDITGEELPDGFRFRLTSPAALDRLPVSISHDTLADYQSLQGTFYEALPALLLTADELNELPKVRVLDSEGNVLWTRDLSVDQ